LKKNTWVFDPEELALLFTEISQIPSTRKCFTNLMTYRLRPPCWGRTSSSRCA